MDRTIEYTITLCIVYLGHEVSLLIILIMLIFFPSQVVLCSSNIIIDIYSFGLKFYLQLKCKLSLK